MSTTDILGTNEFRHFKGITFLIMSTEQFFLNIEYNLI